MAIPFTLQLNQLQLKARLGVYEWERQEERIFPLDVSADILADAAVQQDQLEATLNYEALEQLLLNHAASQPWQLIERLLPALAEQALEQFPQIQALHFTLHKPQALQNCTVNVKYSATRD